ncbi:hypothetical protein AAEX28_04710 [Lentisphaerota bacterium WC36G]|nr:hypothetical protein LJT99_07570 [Lentisphaerae bacterium WC36]
MNLSQVDICNKALLKASLSPITSFEENNKSARCCKSLYELTKQSLLASFPFNFATKNIALQAVDKTVLDYSNAFVLPTDYLHLQKTDADDYEVCGNEIHTNNGSLSIKYTANIDNPNLFSASFIDVFVLHLAAEFSQAFGAGGEKYTTFMNEANNKLQLAMRSNVAQNTPPTEPSDNPFADARR